MSVVFYTESNPAVSTGTGAASTATATLTSGPGRVAFINGFVVSGLGATAAGTAAVTVTGVQGGTQTYQITIPAGATVAVPPVQVNFPMPLPASGANTNIVVSAATFGAGNTTSNVTAYGYIK